MEYSVLMSVYKKEKAEFLKEAIESIQKQSKKQMILCWYVMVS